MRKYLLSGSNPFQTVQINLEFAQGRDPVKADFCNFRKVSFYGVLDARSRVSVFAVLGILSNASIECFIEACKPLKLVYWI
jgi:hypothetical protein